MSGFLLLTVAAVALTVGAELFAEHASSAARRFGISVLAVGLVVAGAEPEELVTAIFASVRHRPAMAAGDAVGANVTMLTVVLGLAALIRPLPVRGRVRGYALAAAGAGATAAGILATGRVDRWAGGALVGGYLGLVAVIWWRERRPPAFGEVAELDDRRTEGQAAPGAGGDTRAVLLVVAGIAGMAAGGRLAVAGAERVVDALGLHDSVVGLTFVALATTAELLALVWAAGRRGVAELAVAGVLGSAVYNATATLGVAALIHPVPAAGLQAQAWLAAGLPAVLVAWVRAFGRFGRVGGGLLVLLYIGYLALTFTGH